MPTILAKIRRKIREGDFRIGLHCLEELAKDDFSAADALYAITSAVEFDRLTGDESHVRYLLLGRAKDGRALNVVVYFEKGSVILKTAYEPF